MRLNDDIARGRLVERTHGVLCTLDPGRGPAPEPVVFTLSPDADHVGIPIDRVKAKRSSRLRREDNLAADARAALLIEHWDAQDWSRLWWVRAHLEHLRTPSDALMHALADQLALRIPQYVDKPFHRVLVFRILAVTGWSAE